MMVMMQSSESQNIEVVLESKRRLSRRRRLVLIPLAILLLCGSGLLAYRFLMDKNTDEKSIFETAVVRRGDLKSSITATGTVEALNTVEVGAEISGQIQKIYVDFNDSVKKDELLIKLDPQQQEAAVAEAKAKVLAARAGQAEAKALLLEATQAENRVKSLAERGLASGKELEAATASAARARAALDSARASAALAQATYESAKSRLVKTEIRSPIDGTVLSREVEVGQAINAGMQTPVLFVIAEDLKRMRLSSQVDEADIGKVHVDAPATFTVDAYPDRKFKSKVTSVRNLPTTDQNVVSYEVLLSVNNAELLLKPGMTATVDIITEAVENALLVPNKALRFSPPTQDRGMGPPRGIPFLGPPRMRSKSKGQTGSPPEGVSNNGSKPLLGPKQRLGPKQGLVWILEGDQPQPIRIVKLATDGVDTAVDSTELKDGMEILLNIVDRGQQ